MRTWFIHNLIIASFLAVVFISSAEALWPFLKSKPKAPQYYGPDQGYHYKNPQQQQQYGWYKFAGNLIQRRLLK
ncbi:hypothetical protein BJ742DRAFT_865875, partial [Cladochytrium replicatum]